MLKTFCLPYHWSSALHYSSPSALSNEHIMFLPACTISFYNQVPLVFKWKVNTCSHLGSHSYKRFYCLYKADSWDALSPTAQSDWLPALGELGIELREKKEQKLINSTIHQGLLRIHGFFECSQNFENIGTKQCLPQTQTLITYFKYVLSDGTLCMVDVFLLFLTFLSLVCLPLILLSLFNSFLTLTIYWIYSSSYILEKYSITELWPQTLYKTSLNTQKLY